MIYQIKNGEKQFLSTIVFDNIDFNIKKGEKVALVGRNGAGKTTLMRIIVDEISLDSGDIYKSNDFEVGYLSQSFIDDDNNSIIDEVRLVFKKNKELKIKLDEASKLLEENPHDENLLRRYSNFLNKFEILGGFNYEYEMYQVLDNFGFTKEMYEQKVSTLSGGEQTKLSFVKLLLLKPDLLLLDEPTNHLDLSTIEWLEGYLKQYPQAVLITSHDQTFLDNIVSKVWEISNMKLKDYSGNYSEYEVSKKSFIENQRKHYIQQQAEIKRLEKVIDKFRATPNKASFAKSKMKYLERMDKIELDYVDENVFKANFKSGIRGSNKVLEVKDLIVGYDKALAKFSFIMNKNERIAIIGDNGSGKSTFIKTIMDKTKALSGEFLWGHSIDVGYFDQQLALINSNKTVLEEVWNEYPFYTQSEIRTILGSFLFYGDDVFKLVNVLSGGEKVRLSLLKVMLSKANTLVLDEPTNHLDILSKRKLAEALNEFDGSILFVSHDRHFIDQIATKIMLIKDNEVIIYPGTYSEYKNKISSEAIANEVKVEKKVVKVKKTYSNNWIKNIEKNISDLEAKLEKLKSDTFLEEVYSDYKKLEDTNKEIENLQLDLDNLLEDYYEYLESIEN